jgi:hypothetical protein
MGSSRNGGHIVQQVTFHNETPTRISFKSQKGDCGLQKSYWAPDWDGGVIDILLRGGVRLSRILQHGRMKAILLL